MKTDIDTLEDLAQVSRYINWETGIELCGDGSAKFMHYVISAAEAFTDRAFDYDEVDWWTAVLKYTLDINEFIRNNKRFPRAEELELLLDECRR